MKRTKSQKLTIIFILLCFFNSVVSAELSNSSGNDEVGYVRINVIHRGLEVKLDGNIIGYTPLSVLTVPVGVHTISVAHFDKSNWLGTNWVEDLTVAKDDTIFLYVNFTRSISINSSPYDAEVFIENQFMGRTPFFFEIDEGEKQDVTLKKKSYQDTTFIVNDAGFEKIHIRLNEVKKSTTMELDARFEIRKRKAFKNRFLWALGASALSGGLALYFRTKADDKYNRYRKTGNPESFNNLYDDAKALDKYAAVSYGTFQVSFVFSFYFFFAYNNH